MIKINTLSKTERKLLATNAESFYPMYHKQARFTPQFATLKLLCKGKYDKEIWTYITAITKAIRYGNTKTFMSFDAKVYNLASKVTKHTINCQKMVEVAKLLEAKGYIVKYKGFQFEEDSCISIIEFTSLFLDMFDEEVCKSFGSARDLSHIEMYNTHYIINSKGKEVKVKELMSLKGKRGYGEVKKDLTDFNKVIENSVITVAGEVRSDILYKQIFEKSFDGAGRFYTFGSFQTLTKAERSTIGINGEDTYSEDYVAIHPNIIRTWLGIPTPIYYDPYTIELSKLHDKKELRDLCKVGLMCLLYNRTKGKAVQALTRKITKDKTSDKIKYRSLHKYRGIGAEIIDKLIELNSDIASEFFQEDLWYRLQGADAKIAGYVINHFISQQVCLLPWHDSFRLGVSYKLELKAVMREAWLNVLGDLTHCRTSEE